jgi:hypothetical protein
MIDDSQFSLKNLVDNPSFDFLHNLNNETDNSEDFDSDSPYNSTLFDCSYSDLDNYVSTNLTNSNFKIMSLNIQSLSSKFSDLKEVISIMHKNNSAPDIICLQELWSFHIDSVFSLPGYSKLIYKKRTDGVQGGGVGFYYKSDLKCCVLPKYSIFEDRIFESLFINVTLPNGKKVAIGSIYRPNVHPTLSSTFLYNNFMEIFSNIISNLLDDQIDFYLVGDFNIDILKINENVRASDYINLLFSFGLLQILTKPTRCSDNSASLIDHIITNRNSASFKSVILTTQISDHFPIVHFLDDYRQKMVPKFFETRDFSAAKLNNFNQTLNNINWNFVEQSPCAQSAYNNFSDLFLNLYQLHFPLKKVRLNKNFHKIEPWFSAGLLISRSKKFALSSEYSKTRSVASKNAYNSYRNIYNRLVKAAKKLYFDNEFKKNSSNLKRTWDLLRFAINSDCKTKTPINEIFSEGIRSTDPTAIAEKLNLFFTTAPQKIVDEIPSCSPFKNYARESHHLFSLSDSPVTRTEIYDALLQLQSKKSEDMYGISMLTIKKMAPPLVNPLYHIIYKVFLTGHFPEQLKIAKVIPIHKGGDPTAPDNYRPISLLPNFAKIIEKVLSNRLTHFLESNNLLCQEQFGFRKSHSTLHPLIHFLNNLSKAKTQNKFSIAIFCDLRKAFDTVNHDILIKKLFHLGIRGVELDLFKSYLSNRKQFVHINGTNSSLLSIILGVPQGSILGPLLFLIYKNDLPSCNNLINSLFADDTMLFDSHESLPLLVTKINSEFQKVITYFNQNKLSLHKEKTKFILFFKNGGPDMPNIVFNYNDISSDVVNPDLIYPMHCINNLPVPTIKFLGVTIDPFLTFKDHISIINRKISTGLFFLRKSKNLLNEKSLKFLYFALVHSHLIYAIHVYSTASENLLKGLFLQQKKAIRIITNSSYNAHTEPLFKKTCILPFPNLCEFFKVQFMHSFKNNFLPSSFLNTWTTNRERRADQAEIELRNDNDFFIPLARSNKLAKFPLTSFPQIWHNFPDGSIKFIRNKIEFNSKLKKHYINELSPSVSCTRLFCPSCHLDS